MRRRVPETSVDACLEDGGLILSIGSLSVWLDQEVAIDVMVSIAAALSSEEDSESEPRRPEDASDGTQLVRVRAFAKA
jgi:hypothetical protein